MWVRRSFALLRRECSADVERSGKQAGKQAGKSERGKEGRRVGGVRATRVGERAVGPAPASSAKKRHLKQGWE